jgi:hypothetical protein
MHLSSRQNKNRTYKNYNSKYIKKGKDISVHRSLRLLLDLERRLNSTSDRASPALLLLNRNLYKWRATSIVWCIEFHRQGVFIGVPGAVTNLIKSVIHQVLAGRPSHMAGHQARPPPTPGLGFHSTASWRGSPPRKLTGGCKVGLAGLPPTGLTC